MITVREATSPVTAYQRQLLGAHRERQARFAEAARMARKRAASALPPPLKEAHPIKARQIPSWEVTAVSFDAHVIAYRMWLALEVQRLRDALAPVNDAQAFIPDIKRPAKEILDEFLTGFPPYSMSDLRSSRRTRKLVDVRHMAMYALRVERPDLSFPRIGRIFGGFDHTTVLHAVTRVEHRADLRERALASVAHSEVAE